MLHVDHASLDILKQHDLVLHNINKNYLYMDVISHVSWRVWIVSYQFAWGHPLIILPKVEMVWKVWNFVVLWMLVPNTFFVNVWWIWCHIKQLEQWFDLRLKGLTWWATNLSHCYIAQIKISLWMPLHPMKYHKHY